MPSLLLNPSDLCKDVSLDDDDAIFKARMIMCISMEAERNVTHIVWKDKTRHCPQMIKQSLCVHQQLKYELRH